MANSRGQQQQPFAATSTLLPTLENENQARVHGRAFAKQIFGQMQWKRIGSKADESAKLYESVANGAPASNGRYTVRAVRHVRAKISEIEVVLATSARYGALAVLLQGAYSSGGAAIEYGQVLHQTGEREHVSIEYASLRPYTNTLGMENHVLLNYSLATMLQRTRKTKSGRTDSISVPSVLHLLRPVDFPDLTKKRRDFQRDYLSRNDFSITYIIQESSKPGLVTLEVVLTCSDEELMLANGGHNNKGVQSQKQKERMWQDALSLTRIHQLVENYRESRNVNDSSEASSVASTSSNYNSRSTRASTVPGASGGAVNLSSITSQPGGAGASSNGCCICHKKFGPFRWKHHCEVCARSACDRCLSVIANPTAVRKKKRVCNNCLYGPHGLVDQAPQHQSQPQPVASERPVQAPVPVLKQKPAPVAPRRSTQPSAGRSENQFPPAPPTLQQTGPAASRRKSAPPPPVQTRTSRSGSRAPPPPVPEYDRSSKKYATRASRVSSSTSSVYSDSEDDEYVRPTLRARRAQTVTIDEVQCKPVAERTKSFRMMPVYRSSFSPVARPKAEPLENLRLTTLTAPEPSASAASAALYRQRLNFHQLKTPEADYELDFNWLNIFPKAPVSLCDSVRVRYLETTLKMDPQSIVFLRHDPILEQHAHRVLDVATQWHGCSINVASKTHVYCLLNASSEMDASSGKPALVVDDMMPREESASSYAVYHNSPFFVSELAADDRFHAHPLCTDHDAMSFLSFPIYAASASTTSKNQAQCIGTLDLWKLDQVAASSHVSQDWWLKMETLVTEIGSRVEELAKESSLFQKPRTAKAYSVDTTSSCDSRGSTWRDDDGSFELDLFDLEADININSSPPLSGSNTYHNNNNNNNNGEEDTVPESFYVKGRSLSMASLADSRLGWKYSNNSSRNSYHASNNDADSDNESVTSSCSNSSRTSRSSCYSQRYSAAELHSTIESLLHQANETSSMVYSTGVQI
ncbi:hypothetical protein Gpo141_00008153 [Globisporangium polare]